MSFSSELLDLHRDEGRNGVDRAIDGEGMQRLDHLADFSPVYRNLLRRYPKYLPWLEDPNNRDETFRFSAFDSIWEKDYKPSFTRAKEELAALQRFRRQMSLRIAYRELNGFGTIDESLFELTLLAEFCLGKVLALTIGQWEKNLGQPWDEDIGQPAKFCILGLGKFGGRELNFCSDLDLIYLFEGRGHCRKHNRRTRIGNEEYFARLCKDITSNLQERTEEGFLFNVDLRLRPEGDSGLIVRSLSAMENYYFSAGQTWERLALIKARPVAGDLALGDELFEGLNSFRYPRYPPPSLLSEVAGVKLRIEKEMIGFNNLDTDIKSGHGGIREIEFFVQALQLRHAGRNPFLQANSTLEAIERLSRYDLIASPLEVFLNEAYRFLRKVEHRLQIREERQTHTLPSDAEESEPLARSLGFEREEEFAKHLGEMRSRVRENYLDLFKRDSMEEEIQEWTLFLSGGDSSSGIRDKLKEWFGDGADERESRLRKLVLGAPGNLITREHLVLFMELSKQFKEVLRPLANPLPTLERITQFAERYGARKEFFKTCQLNPQLFQALSLLFDRSEFIYELLCRYPEILEEIFATGLRRRKGIHQIEREISHLAHESDFTKWLWLYVKAEQVRLAIAELLGACDELETEEQLTDLADAVLSHLLKQFGLDEALVIVGMGKFGAREMSFGSDLDLLLLSGDDFDAGARGSELQNLLQIITYREPQGRIFDLDLRLRPHGKDGPLVTKTGAFSKYHRSGAHTWERQILTRARVVAGNKGLAERFSEIRDQLLYAKPITGREIGEINTMRLRIENEKAKSDLPQFAFKAGPGGILDIEFLTQIFQLKHGAEMPPFRSANTRKTLNLMIQEELMDRKSGLQLLENYEFLRKIELYLRRSINRSVSVIDGDTNQLKTLSTWLGFRRHEEFWKEHTSRMRTNRKNYEKLIDRSSKDPRGKPRGI